MKRNNNNKMIHKKYQLKTSEGGNQKRIMMKMKIENKERDGE